MLYAVHYAWIDDHAKAPVGIWAEGGASFYPAEWAVYRDKGTQAATESAGKVWADWVAMRTEYGSTYGASWRAVESDRPMEEVLTALQEEFFSVEHPVQTITLNAPEPEPEPELDTSEATDSPPPPPAPRFVAAQAWWIASELCRRRSQLRIVETWPMDGFYHGLEVGQPGHKRWVFMNYHGRIHLHVPDRELEPVTWFEVLAAQSPHDVVRSIESSIGWPTSHADPTTARSLTYRVIAACLTHGLNDRHPWTVMDGHTASGANGWSEGDLGFLDHFEGARRAVEHDKDSGALARVWVLRRGEHWRVLLTDRGRLYRHGQPDVDLMVAYRERQRLGDVTAPVLEEAEA